MDKYRMLSKKGEGTFSEVLKCVNIRDGTYWACKKMKQRYESAEEVKSIREIQALRLLGSNPNILQLQEVIFERKTGILNLIFELMDMNLYELIRSQRTYFSGEKSANFMLQLLKAVEHMHKHGYFHRDIKPENILVKGDMLKLADFGSVRKINTTHPYTEYISTRWYRAPECLLTDGFYSYPMDIWSVGCVMFEILTLQPLFPGSNELDQIDKIHNILGTPDPSLLEKFRLQSRNIRYAFKPKKGVGLTRYMTDYPHDAVDLISILCTYDPDRRITAHRALKHSYFDTVKELLTNGDKENEITSPPDTGSGSMSGGGVGGRHSKQSGSEPNSVLEIYADNSSNGINQQALVSSELFKPILKRKKYNIKSLTQLNPILLNKTLGNGASLSALNQTNNNNSASFSVLSNYSDQLTGQQTQKPSAHHLKYQLKKPTNYLTTNGGLINNANLHLPKLGGGQYVQLAALNPYGVTSHNHHLNHLNHHQYQHHQSSPSMHSIFAKLNQLNSTNNMGAAAGSGGVLPDLYSTTTTSAAAAATGPNAAGQHHAFVESKIIGGAGFGRLHTKF